MFDLSLLLKAAWETWYMVFVSSVVGIGLGLLLGVTLFFGGRSQHKCTTGLHHGLGIVINITRSVPFIILLIGVIPLTSLLVGTYIGTTAAIVPLAIAAIAFYARVSEAALAEVSTGLLEAAIAMGTTRWQLVRYVLLPEALPGLVKGATLTIIGLVGYSAMAGAVGGGGLGELAINYGYQRFNPMIILQTVIILVILVQLLQSLGDWIAKTRKVWGLYVALIIATSAALLPLGITTATTDNNNVIRVGIVAGVQQDIMQVAKKIAQTRYGVTLDILTFDDYALPNVALNDNKIDANIFQHQPFLDAQVHDRGFKLIPIGKTFVYPMGFYSEKINSIQQLPRNALVVLANDPSNQARGLLLLQQAGLIELKPGVTTDASLLDVIRNPKQLRLVAMDAAQLAHALSDADLVAINSNFLLDVGLTPEQAIIRERADSPYANIIVVNQADQTARWVSMLVAIMHSPEVVKTVLKKYPSGGAIRAW